MIINERETRKEYMLEAAKQIMLAARTAPKGKGVDIIEIITLSDEDIDAVSEELLRLAEKTGMKFLIRDSENIQSADAMIVIGTRQAPQGLNCAYCGYATCAEKPQDTPCAINSIDVGIAIGFGLRQSCRFESRQPGHVLGRLGRRTAGPVEKLPPMYRHTHQRVIEKPLLRP